MKTVKTLVVVFVLLALALAARAYDFEAGQVLSAANFNDIVHQLSDLQKRVSRLEGLVKGALLLK